MTDNQTLLAEYVQTGSDAAFRELVKHYVALVYSTALRLVNGDTHRAEDVTQTVLVDLARLARTLPANVLLGGWLHRHTCFVAATLMRGERRRQTRERQALEMNSLQTNSDADYSLVAPILDDAINELDEPDRTAILLRFFEQHDFRSIGQTLGSNEDAARMRVTRALEKLEAFLKRRGVTTSAASLGAVLTANAIQAAPVGLVVTISTAAALAGTTLAATTSATATKAIAMTTLQKAIVTATIAALAGAGIYEARHATQLRDQVQTLRQQQAGQIQQLESEHDAAANRLAALVDEMERAKGNSSELLKLRGEVARLRKETEALATASKEARDFKADMMQVLSNTPPIRSFVSTIMTTTTWDQTVVTGGWKTPSGKRVIALVSLYPGDDGKQLTISSKILEYPEEAGEKLGLSPFKFDERTPDGTAARGKAHTITSEQAETILKAAKASDGTEIIAAPSVTTVSGLHSQVQAVDIHSTPSGEKYSTGPVLDFIPTISPDGQSVQIVISAQLNYPIPIPQR